MVFIPSLLSENSVSPLSPPSPILIQGPEIQVEGEGLWKTHSSSKPQ